MSKKAFLIISLDFELHWGVFEKVKLNSPYMRNLLNTPEVIDRMLKLFKENNISATWATVGLLFAESYTLRTEFEPSIKPVYSNTDNNPYLLQTGTDEKDDPIHYASSIIKKIQAVPGQEIATHTFSHFSCSSEGATIEAFLSDLESAVKMARNYGITINSIVFPRNQLVKEFIDALPEKGISVFRGAEKGWMYSGITEKKEDKLSKIRKTLNKLGRILDTYIPITGSNTWSVDELFILTENKPVNIPASRFVRPFNPHLGALEWLKYLRIKNQIKYAARHGKMVHLRWHPHNFGSNIDKNIAFLEKILDFFEFCRSEYGMESMTMYEYSKLLKKH
jgi:peptidoglycan/xylan/chitin deacetylase (PgdA/CDA1 family)